MEDNVIIKIVHYNEIDKEEFCRLQRIVFTPLLTQAGGSASFITPLFFEWKYNTPFGRAYIAFVEKNGKMVGSNSMIPINLIVNGKVERSWQSCDTAVLPEERGKGYFSSCVSKLKTKITAGEYFWGFPNANSIKGFLTAGWIKNCYITLWIKPLFYLKNKQGMSNMPISFNNDFVFPDKITLEADIYAQKTKEYFYWRYLQHPFYKYFIESAVDDKNNVSAIVFREVNIKGKKLLMLMDYVGCYKILRKIINKKILLYAQANNIHYVGYWGNAFTNFQLLQLGFLPVPNFLLPKTQILCSEKTGDVTKKNKSIWITQTGDYDLF